MRWYEKIIAAHTAVTSAVSHIRHLKSERYFVWQEDGENVLYADGEHSARAVSGSTDLFTKQEFDPWVDELGKSFRENDIPYSYIFVEYEEDTGFYHHSWYWEVLDGQDQF